MNRIFVYLICSLVGLFLTACTTVKKEGPAVSSPAVKPRLSAAKSSLKEKKSNVSQIPPVLGGLVQSDSWIIYKDKQEEEFKGNVSYDNGAYQFKADYALSQRAKKLFTAKGNVFLRQNELNGSFYEARSDQARFNYRTQTGTLTATGKNQVHLRLQDEKQQTASARARQVSFDLISKIFVLEGDVYMERPTEEGLNTLEAQKVTFKQLENYALLEGDAKLSDGKRNLEAQTIVYDGQHNTSSAVGQRPLAYGETDQGTFAIIADEVLSDSEGTVIQLNGKVQGWVVSPQLNDEKINSKF